MKGRISAILFLLPFLAPCQELSYAHRIVDTLTSPGMDGRGYVNGGDRKAALYIAEEFRKMKADSMAAAGYFQPFHFPVNTFPGVVKITVDGRTLKPGADYILDASCPTAHGKFEITEATAGPGSIKKSKLRKKFILIDKTKKGGTELAQAWIAMPGKAAGFIIMEEKKLTWTVAQEQGPMPMIHILKASMPSAVKTVSLDVDASFVSSHPTQNIAGLIKGISEPDSFIVFTAHYDHLGRMGANDNASGIAMLLNLLSYYSEPANRPACSMAFIAFAGEEAGLLGSEYYTGHPLFPLERIKFLVNMDLLGTGDDGMMVVNGDVYRDAFSMLTLINDSAHYVATLGKRGKAKNSDHYYFSEKGVPSFFFYTLGGTAFYHDIYDAAATLPFTDFEDVFRLTRDFTNALMKQ